MTPKDVAQRLASALKNQHPALIQNYAVSHIEYTLHRELNALAADAAESNQQKEAMNN